MKQKQRIQKKEVGIKQINSKNKIQYLHKMLDNEIQTVNSLFAKDNAFQKIQAKLKNLEVKLNSIKEQNTTLNTQYVTLCRNKSKLTKNQRPSIEKESSVHQQQLKYASTSNLPFQTLSHYKKSKKKGLNNHNSNQIQNKSCQKYNQSGRKLNFDISDEQNQQVKTQNKKKKSKNSKSKIKKTRSQKYIASGSKKRSKSNNQRQLNFQQNNNNSKILTRQNSSKKKKVSISKSQKTQIFNRKSSQKKIAEIKSPIKQLNWKNLVTMYNNNNLKQKHNQICNQQQKRRDKLKQIVRKGQQKRLQRQLANFKIQNQNLQSQVNQLKGYKIQFQRLKEVFQKQEKIRKIRKNF